MNRLAGAALRTLIAAVVAVAVIAPRAAGGQDADPRPVKPDTSLRFPNTTAGEFTPGRGFDIITTDFGSLNISLYGMWRYVDQAPGGGVFTDHLGRERRSNLQNSLNWQRAMIWFTGFFYDPRFRYNVTSWSLGSTQQNLIFGNFQYVASKHFTFGVGMFPNLTARSLQGSFPFWAAFDRQMAEEFFRGGFSSGAIVTGEMLPRLDYTLSVNNNISQLGVTQANDSRNVAVSGSLRWQPTTGEFGPRNGFGDLEYHKRVATQFGVSAGHSRETRGADTSLAPSSSQIKLSDGVNPFDEGALAEGVIVTTLTYRELAIDAGVKYRGFSFQSEYYFRTLNDFVATGPLPLTSIYDHGFFAEAMYMVVPKKLGVYTAGGYIFDQFRRQPWELGGGADFYPTKTRNWRLNLHLLHIDKSPASSFFGYYLAGQTGTIFSLGTDILF